MLAEVVILFSLFSVDSICSVRIAIDRAEHQACTLQIYDHLQIRWIEVAGGLEAEAGCCRSAEISTCCHLEMAMIDGWSRRSPLDSYVDTTYYILHTRSIHSRIYN